MPQFYRKIKLLLIAVTISTIMFIAFWLYNTNFGFRDAVNNKSNKFQIIEIYPTPGKTDSFFAVCSSVKGTFNIVEIDYVNNVTRTRFNECEIRPHIVQGSSLDFWVINFLDLEEIEDFSIIFDPISNTVVKIEDLGMFDTTNSRVLRAIPESKSIVVSTFESQSGNSSIELWAFHEWNSKNKIIDSEKQENFSCINVFGNAPEIMVPTNKFPLISESSNIPYFVSSPFGVKKKLLLLGEAIGISGKTSARITSIYPQEVKCQFSVSNRIVHTFYEESIGIVIIGISGNNISVSRIAYSGEFNNLNEIETLYNFYDQSDRFLDVTLIGGYIVSVRQSPLEVNTQTLDLPSQMIDSWKSILNNPNVTTDFTANKIIAWEENIVEVISVKGGRILLESRFMIKEVDGKPVVQTLEVP